MKKKKGQAVVEIALMLPILALLLCGIADFGRILFAANNINMVSQEAARYASLGGEDVANFAKGKCALSDNGTLAVNVSHIDPVPKYGDCVKVDISYNVNYITPLMQVFIKSDHFTVNASSTIRVE